MAKVDLTIGETKSKQDLTLEDKNTDTTWADLDVAWEDYDGTWDKPYITSTLEDKSKDDLTLGETK